MTPCKSIAGRAGNHLRCAMAAVLVIGTVQLPSTVAAKPKPDEIGDVYCFRNNDRDLGETSVDLDAHRCCYWEDTGEGEALQVCLQCDENWRNCVETPSSATTLPRGPGGSKPGMSIAPSPGPLGSGGMLPGKVLDLPLKVQRRTD